MAEYSTIEQTYDSLDALFATGKRVKVIRASATITNGTHASGDIFRVAKGIPLNTKVVSVFVPAATTGITGLSDVDLGVYKSNGGAVIDKDILIDGQSFASSVSVGDINDAVGYKTLGELLSLNNSQEYAGGVDIAFTLNATPSASGTLGPVLLILA